jgi:hypothetical protein
VSSKPPVGGHCPKCGQFRVMDGYTRETLQLLLDTGEPIKGWCQSCGETWVFSAQARAGIAKGLAEGL